MNRPAPRSFHAFLGLAIGLGICTTNAAAQTRGPYLQRGTPTEMTLVWRSAASEASSVCYGASPTTLATRATAAAGTQHVVRITGLTPATRYYYAVGTYAACPPAVAGNGNHYFETSLPTGAVSPFRIWLLGDSGNASTAQTNVRNQMLSYVGANRPDLFVHVGDMAYDTGTTAEFDSRFFGYYQSVIQNIPCWPAIGNHEGASSDSATQTGPYYDAYVLPTDGSAGGLPSNTEAYYAFDYGNVHFIALDSYETSRATNGAMLTWMAMDVAATSQPWIVAFWHHPPYTKGSHDSDTETELVQMRQNALPILEANGVDLVWGGHSHIYERSFLVHGAYDTPTTAATHIVDNGDGRLAGNGAYMADGSGAVYVVAGHGGASVSGSANHPLMYFSEVDYGSCIVDVDDDTLTLTNVRDDGVLSDDFTMQKPGPLTVLTPGNGSQIEQGSTVAITWTTGGPSAVSIAYSSNGGATFTTVVASTPNDGAFSWTAPTTTTTTGIIRLADATNAGTFDQSGTFSIVGALPQVLVPYGSTWEYLDSAAPPANWQTTTGGWASGPAQLGYGDGDEATVLFDTNPNVPTVYFRRALVLDRAVTSASVSVLFDDGYAVYVNGTLVASKNVGNGTGHAAWASATSAENELQTSTINLATNPFVVGTNVIAVLVKQVSSTSSDVSFDLELTLTRAPIASVDECALGTDDCDVHASCTDTPGAFVCTCNAGYAGSGTVCADVDECTLGTDNCIAPNATCTNTVGSFVCGCAPGYTGNGTASCSDVNECLSNNGGCSTSPLVTCTNVPGGRTCGACPSGYSGNGILCADVNECLTNNGGCSSSPLVTCSNTAGGRTCGACPIGYAGDGVTCTDVNECVTNNGGCSTTPMVACVNTAGGRSCGPCPSGYVGDGVSCVDVNECLTNNGGCSSAPLVACTNTLGGRTCAACPGGYVGDGVICTSVDGCAPSNPCAHGGACTPTGPGTFACSCSAGWTGPLCTTDVDECATGGGCAATAGCTNTPGAWTCTCGLGYVGDGTTCTNVDDCMPNPCLNGGSCTDAVAGFACACPAGFAGSSCQTVVLGCQTMPCLNGGACTDGPAGSFSCVCASGYVGATCATPIDVCASANPCVHGSCTSTGAGLFTCACASGWDGALCETDVDECAAGSSPCDPAAACVNLQGAFMCTCGAGYVGDGASCVDVDECVVSPAICGAGTCSNTPGSHECACESGYVAAGGTCVLADACTAGTDACDPHATCTPSAAAPGYLCECDPGFGGSGTSCVDIDECTLGTTSCDPHASCTNLSGAYSCACDSGYAGDGTRCVANGTDAGGPPVDASDDAQTAALDGAMADGAISPQPSAGCGCGLVGAHGGSWGSLVFAWLVAIGARRLHGRRHGRRGRRCTPAP